MQKSCTQTFVYLNVKIPKQKYNPYKKRNYMWLKRYTCSLCNKKYTSSYSIDHSNEPKICYSCDF